jgi:hypothetical protein
MDVFSLCFGKDLRMSKRKINLKPHLAFLLALSILLWMEPPKAADSARQAEVAERGATVMPFALNKTLHQFNKTESGGVQKVLVRDADDQPQIKLIQQHLSELAVKFSKGDYSGPEKIHGADMPGLAELKSAAPGSINISYQPEADGASLTFVSQDKLLIQAVHDWFDAQVHDHGHDAMMMHHMHHP